jgi:hypothetical protein
LYVPRVTDARFDDIDALSDVALAERAASVLAVPRAEIVGDRLSFVLHAPLELLARVALLPLIEPTARPLARRRIAVLAEGYAESGPPLAPARRAEFVSPAAAAGALAAAIEAEDFTAVDESATWLAANAGIRALPPLLAPTFLDRLSAAGHANIYLALLSRPAPSLLGAAMLRPVARAVALGASQRIAVPPIVTGGDAGAIASMLAATTHVGPPEIPFIAPLVLRAEEQGAFAGLRDAQGCFAAPQVPPGAVLRVAARTMLQGTPDEAPYGWTHCLTLAQAPLLLAGAGAVPVGPAAWVASAYVAAHWACYGSGTVDLDTPVTCPTGITATSLASVAATSHDAHLVKYTLACLDAAAADPTQRDLYMAAAAHLQTWWAAHSDPSDPLREEMRPVLSQ